jgi:hypothetical protein
MQNRKVKMWALAIEGYNVEIVYIKGTANTCADMLSRVIHPPLTPKEELEINCMADIPDQTLNVSAVNT